MERVASRAEETMAIAALSGDGRKGPRRQGRGDDTRSTRVARGTVKTRGTDTEAVNVRTQRANDCTVCLVLRSFLRLYWHGYGCTELYRNPIRYTL